MNNIVGKIIAVHCLLALTGIASVAPTAAQVATPAVDVANPLVRSIREWDQYSGRFEAVKRVELRARVSGYLKSIHFKDGQIVKKGDLLFVIDPRPIEAELTAAQARLVSAKAKLKLSEAELKRGELLYQRKVTSEAVLDSRRADQAVAAADVLVAEAVVQSTMLNLGFTNIYAPVSGRVSDARIDVGNLVAGGSSGATLLTTIVSLDPIYFIFDVSERAYLKYVRLDRSGSRPASRTTPNPVYIRLVDETGWPHRGAMNFVDNQVGQETGTLRGRAILSNSDRILQPGLFGQMRLLGSGQYDAVLIPDKAVLSDQASKIVLVVDDKNVVAVRQVKLGPIVDGLRVVRSGLGAADRIIVSGVQRVRAGVTVVPTSVKIKAVPDGFDPTVVPSVPSVITGKSTDN